MGMFLFGPVIALLPTAVLAQDPPVPQKQETLPAGKQKLPSFPKDKARWVLRGKARADAMLKPRRLEVPPKLRERFPQGICDESRACHPMHLGLAGVVVSVAEVPWAFPVGRPAMLTVVDGRFSPHVVAVVAGQELMLRNPFRVEVLQLRFRQTRRGMEVNMPLRNRWGRTFNGVLSMNARASYAVTIPEVVSGRIESQSHAWLHAAIHVLSNPVYAITDEHGRFVLPPLPDGDYELVAIHELLGKVTKKVTVQGKDPKPVTFVFKVPEELRQK